MPVARAIAQAICIRNDQTARSPRRYLKREDEAGIADFTAAIASDERRSIPYCNRGRGNAGTAIGSGSVRGHRRPARGSISMQRRKALSASSDPWAPGCGRARQGLRRERLGLRQAPLPAEDQSVCTWPPSRTERHSAQGVEHGRSLALMHWLRRQPARGTTSLARPSTRSR
jgi:hypothetical protein